MTTAISIRIIICVVAVAALVTIEALAGARTFAFGSGLIGAIGIAMYVAYQLGRAERRAAMTRGER